MYILHISVEIYAVCTLYLANCARDVLYNTVLTKRVVSPSAIISLAGKIAKCKVEIPGVQIMTVNNQSARI